MGCYWFIRRKNINTEFETFFMHSDSWGQYGKKTSEVDILNFFTYGYKQILL